MLRFDIHVAAAFCIVLLGKHMIFSWENPHWAGIKKKKRNRRHGGQTREEDLVQGPVLLVIFWRCLPRHQEKSHFLSLWDNLDWCSGTEKKPEGEDDVTPLSSRLYSPHHFDIQGVLWLYCLASDLDIGLCSSTTALCPSCCFHPNPQLHLRHVWNQLSSNCAFRWFLCAAPWKRYTLYNKRSLICPLGAPFTIKFWPLSPCSRDETSVSIMCHWNSVWQKSFCLFYLGFWNYNLTKLNNYNRYRKRDWIILLQFDFIGINTYVNTYGIYVKK